MREKKGRKREGKLARADLINETREWWEDPCRVKNQWGKGKVSTEKANWV